MMTIKDIARLSGFSVGTVSRVINHHPDVSESTRKKVLEIIEQEKFQPNITARTLKQTVGSSIAVFVVGHSNLFFADLVEKVEQRLHSSGEEVNVVYIDERSNPLIEAIRAQQDMKPKGMIFLGGNINEFREDFGKITVPCVLLTNYASSLSFDNLSSFSIDDEKASKEVVKYLLKHGHRNIAVLGGSKESSQTSNRRLESVEQELREHDIPFDESKQYIECRYSLEDGYKGMQKLLETTLETTAIFALSDTIAFGAIRAIKDAGKSCPEDISVVGYDGINVGKYAIPRLCTIRQNTELLAQKSVDNLLLRLNYKEKIAHELVEFEFIEGESVAFLKGAKE